LALICSVKVVAIFVLFSTPLFKIQKTKE
jgi:hypothetical protein